jgi:hypothetical protein
MDKLATWADEMLRLSPGTLDKVLTHGRQRAEVRARRLARFEQRQPR